MLNRTLMYCLILFKLSLVFMWSWYSNFRVKVEYFSKVSWKSGKCREMCKTSKVEDWSCPAVFNVNHELVNNEWHLICQVNEFLRSYKLPAIYIMLMKYHFVTRRNESNRESVDNKKKNWSKLYFISKK